jgi:hypothetical protein
MAATCASPDGWSRRDRAQRGRAGLCLILEHPSPGSLADHERFTNCAVTCPPAPGRMQGSPAPGTVRALGL